MSPHAGLNELAAADYPRIGTLVESSGMRGHLALVYAVLEGRQPGRVYAGQSQQPRTALICNSNGFYFGFGEPDEALLAGVIDRLWQEQRADIYAGVYGSNSAWDAALRRLMEPYGAERAARLAFEYHHPQPPTVSVPPGFQLEPIDERWAARIQDGSGTHGFGIDPWFINTAGGARAYASLGLGLALIQSGQIASIAGVCGLGGGEVELEVGTVPQYRGQGLGQVITAAFMRQLFERGLRPAYSCGERNLPSIAIARKLGFEQVEVIHGYPLFEVEDLPGPPSEFSTLGQ